MNQKFPKHYRSILKSVEAQKSFQDKIKNVAKASNSMKKKMESLAEINMPMQRRIKELSEIKNNLNSVANSVKFVSERIGGQVDSLASISSYFDGITQNYQEFYKSVENIGTVWEQRLKEMEESTQHFKQIFEELDNTARKWQKIYDEYYLNYNYEILDSGAIQVNDEFIPPTDIADIISEINTGLEEHENFETFLDWLIARLDSFKLPARFVILHLILPFLMSLFASLVEPYITQSPHKSRKQDAPQIAEIKKEIQSQKTEDELKNLGLIKINSVRVYSEKTENSKIIDVLRLGKLISPLRRTEEWTQIEFYNKEHENYLKGWVKTELIEQF